MATLTAPTTTKDAIVPGALICSRFGSGRLCLVLKADPSIVTYVLLLDLVHTGEHTMYPEHAELCFSAKEG